VTHPKPRPAPRGVGKRGPKIPISK